MERVRIGLVGDYSPNVVAHRAIPLALQLAAEKAECIVEPKWIHTSELVNANDTSLNDCNAIWCVPGSPYSKMQGAIVAIQHAREGNKPFLGTCGGFQHALIEYARNVLKLKSVEHAETSPDADSPLIAKLSCSLVEKSGPIFLVEDSRLRKIYASPAGEERYHCNYGLNPQLESMFAGTDLLISARDAQGEVRAIELRGHPFFLATLFQPERAALREQSHPLVDEFVRVASNGSA